VTVNDSDFVDIHSKRYMYLQTVLVIRWMSWVVTLC